MLYSVKRKNIISKGGKMWEKILEEGEAKNITVGPHSYRMKVPGGWIVRTIVQAMTSNGGAAVHHIFIKDPEYAWKINI